MAAGESSSNNILFLQVLNPIDLFHHEKNHSNFSGEIKTKESSRKKQLRALCVFRLPICGSNFLLLLLFVFTIRGR